jgi:SAM-dependent methyltransferase
MKFLGLRQKLYQLKRQAYAIRLLIPGLRERHLLEVMVGPRGYWNELRAYQLKALQANGLAHTHSLLDIGCGPLQGGIAFIKYLESSNYVGVDNNPNNLAAGNRQIEKLRLDKKNPQLFLSQNFGREELNNRHFDFLWASQIIYYFDEPILKQLFDVVANHMKPEGKFLVDIVGECPPEYRTANHIKWMNQVNLHSVESLNKIAQPFGLQARSLGEIEQYGYPKSLNLRGNLLLEFTHTRSE